MFRTILVSTLLSASVVFAAESAPTEASIRELLAVSEVRQIVDSIPSQMEGSMRNAMRQAMAGQTPNPEQQAIIDRHSAKLVAAVTADLSWDKLEPLYLSVYSKTFTQEEVDAMIAIYKSPVGQVLTRKMPLVMQQTNREMESRIGPMVQRMQAALREAASELKAAKPAPAPTPAPAGTTP